MNKSETLTAKQAFHAAICNRFKCEKVLTQAMEAIVAATQKGLTEITCDGFVLKDSPSVKEAIKIYLNSLGYKAEFYGNLLCISWSQPCDGD